MIPVSCCLILARWFEVSNLVGTAGDNVTFSVSTTKGVELEYNMQDCLIFKSSEPTSFRMRFSYHEIHYITIRGKLQTDLTVDDIVGYQLFSDLERHGAFTCESQLLTKIYDTTVNNYEGLTTGGQTVDCPHRERRGYGGDGLLLPRCIRHNRARGQLMAILCPTRRSYQLRIRTRKLWRRCLFHEMGP